MYNILMWCAWLWMVEFIAAAILCIVGTIWLNYKEDRDEKIRLALMEAVDKVFAPTPDSGLG